MKAKKIFNTDSRERIQDAKMINGNPNGMIDLINTPHKFAVDVYKGMKGRTWFVQQIDISKDKVNYGRLSKANKRSYDLILSQLITDDSIQVNQLMDSFNRYVTSPVTNLCLSVQAMEEGLHVESYSIMASDIAEDPERIYNLPFSDPELMRKNKAVEAMYNSVYSDDEPGDEDMLLAAGANQLLEELVFPGGFAGMLLLEDEMPGSAGFIREINLHSLPAVKAVA